MTCAPPDYAKESYYKSQFDEDAIRVNDLFATAELNQIHIEKRSMLIEELTTYVISGHLAIVLVDANLLECSECDLGFSSKLFPSFHYSGHYIVVCGFDRGTNQLIYKNPSRTCESCFIKPDALDPARKAFGTDEDILIIFSSMSGEGT